MLASRLAWHKVSKENYLQKIIMKKLPALILLTLSVSVSLAQSFYLPVPEKWTTEIFPIPIEFAPQITYTGEEHLRFAPGWGEPSSEERWTYCFLWWIKGDSKINKESLEKDLKAYYSGLVGRNIISRKIDSALVVPTVAAFNEVNAEKGDSQTYTGTVKMLDYLSLKPIVLNIAVHVMPCTKEGKLGVLFTISPQPKTHALWQKLKAVHDGFRCTQ